MTKNVDPAPAAPAAPAQPAAPAPETWPRIRSVMTHRKYLLYGDRNKTNVFWFWICPFVICLWNAAVMTVFNFGETDVNIKKIEDNVSGEEMTPPPWMRELYQNQSDSPAKNLVDDIVQEVLTGSLRGYSCEFGWIMRMGSVLMSMILLVISMRMRPSCWARFAVVYVVLAMSAMIGLIGMNIANDFFYRVEPLRVQLLFWVVPEAIVFLFCVATLVAMLYTGDFAMSEMLDKSSRILCFFSYLIVYGAVVVLVMGHILNIALRHYLDRTIEDMFLYIILFGSCYLIHFLYYTLRMVAAMLTATYHWTPKKESIRPSAIINAMFFVFHRHFGTLSFNATVIGPFIVGLIAQFRVKVEPAETFANRFVKFFLRIYLTFHIAEYSSIVTAIYGIGVYDASKKTFKTFFRDSTRSLAFLRVYGIAVHVALVFLFTMDLGLAIMNGQSDFHETVVLSISMYLIYMFCAMPLYLTFDAVADTTVICQLNEGHESEELQENVAVSDVTETMA